MARELGAGAIALGCLTRGVQPTAAGADAEPEWVHRSQDVRYGLLDVSVEEAEVGRLSATLTRVRQKLCVARKKAVSVGLPVAVTGLAHDRRRHESR